MYKFLLRNLLVAALAIISLESGAQEELVPNQNPNFAVSRDKYMGIADSVTAWQSTTQQNTYKAIDWLEERKEARADRREFRRQLRLERARWGYGWDNRYYYNNWNDRGWYGGYGPSFRNRRGGLFYNPWRTSYWW